MSEDLYSFNPAAIPVKETVCYWSNICVTKHHSISRQLFDKNSFISPYLQCDNLHGITHYHTMPHFDELKICNSGKHYEKRRIACNKQFLPFSQCFPPYMALIFHYKCTLKCHLQFVSIWTSLKFCRLVIINGLIPNYL